jgi:hypothetical protein
MPTRYLRCVNIRATEDTVAVDGWGVLKDADSGKPIRLPVRKQPSPFPRKLAVRPKPIELAENRRAPDYRVQLLWGAHGDRYEDRPVIVGAAGSVAFRLGSQLGRASRPIPH